MKIQKLPYILVLVLIMLSYQNCSSDFEGAQFESASSIQSEDLSNQGGSSAGDNSSPVSSESPTENFNREDIQNPDNSTDMNEVIEMPKDEEEMAVEPPPVQESAPFLFSKQINLLDETSSDCKFTWTTSENSKSYLKFGTDESALNQKNPGEYSFKHATHIQMVKGLQDKTTYYFQVIAENQMGVFAESNVISCTTKEKVIDPVPQPVVKPPLNTITARDQFWANKGYRKQWSATPSQNDMGKDPETFFRGEWSGGSNLVFYNVSKHKNALALSSAPDGSPSVKSYLPKGQTFGANIKGMQLGSQGPEAQSVWSMQWYNPCVGGQKVNNRSGTYIGFGHIWGAKDGSTRSPGGSKNLDDAWSVRVPLAKSNSYFVYAYKPDKDRASGESYVSPIKPKCDKWTQIELEIIQNNPASKFNGQFNLYIDGQLVREVKNIRTRQVNGVKPRGFGFFVQHNSQAPQNETFYFKDWNIYLK